LEFFCVVVLRSHGIGERGLLMKNGEIQGFGPPLAVAVAAGSGVLEHVARKWALGFVRHLFSLNSGWGGGFPGDSRQTHIAFELKLDGGTSIKQINCFFDDDWLGL